MRYFIYITLYCLLSTTAMAGKLKSADSLLPKLETDIQAIQSVIADIKTYISGVGETGSFVKNDFWGIKPAFYQSAGTGITNLYFLHKFIERRLDNDLKGKYFLREINNIKLNPGELDIWRIHLDFNYSYLFPGDRFSSTLFNSEEIRKYFLSNGVPTENLEPAIEKYIAIHSKLAENFLNKVLLSIDNLYSQVYIGGHVIGDKAFLKIFKAETVHDMKTHPATMKQNLDKFRLSSIREIYGLKTKDEFYESVVSGKLRDYLINFSISNVRYTFEVGKYLDSSQRQSQIIDFDLLLNNKVKQGKAVSSDVTVKVRGSRKDFRAYSDIKDSVKYPSTVYFNKETGKGVWENGYWKSKEEVKAMSDRLNKVNAQYHQSVKKYLDMVKKEIANKYTSRLDSESFSDEF